MFKGIETEHPSNNSNNDYWKGVHTMKKWIVICIFFISLIGCQQEKPEAHVVSGLPTHFSDIALKKYNSMNKEKKLTMQVHHFVKGNKVYIECIVTPNFQFMKGTTKKEGQGYLEVYNNGKKLDEFTSGAFILTNLPKGKNKIDVMLKYNDKSDYGLVKSFTVELN